MEKHGEEDVKSAATTWDELIVDRLQSLGRKLADCDQKSMRLRDRLIGDPPTANAPTPMKNDGPQGEDVPFVEVVNRELDELHEQVSRTNCRLTNLLGE
jgi:hypothetical protein